MAFSELALEVTEHRRWSKQSEAHPGQGEGT